jgi:hypothetical protein
VRLEERSTIFCLLWRDQPSGYLAAGGVFLPRTLARLSSARFGATRKLLIPTGKQKELQSQLPVQNKHRFCAAYQWQKMGFL